MADGDIDWDLDEDDDDWETYAASSSPYDAEYSGDPVASLDEDDDYEDQPPYAPPPPPLPVDDPKEVGFKAIAAMRETLRKLPPLS